MKKQYESAVLLLMLISVQHGSIDCGITIENNGYRNIVIAISDDVPEDTALLDKIREVFTAASQALYTATR